jgi:hypothetical protein
MATCEGNADDHCCYLGQRGVCEHLEEGTVEGRRWACGLRREYGSWDAAHASPDYVEIRSYFRSVGTTVDCGDWPAPGNKCGTCGVIGDG